MNPDIARIAADVAAASDADLSATLDAIRARAAELRGQTPSTEVVAELRELKGARDAVLGEQGRRQQLAAEAAQLADDVSEPPAGQLDPRAGEPEPEENPDAVIPREPAEEGLPPQPHLPGDRPTEDEGGTGGGRTAGARAPMGSIGTQQPAAPQQPSGSQVVVEFAAAGDVRGWSTGQAINSTAELAQAMAAKLQSVTGGRGSAGGSEKSYVATANWQYPEERVLRRGDFVGNLNKLEAVVSPEALAAARAAQPGEVQALVAAGGLCAPLETLYDVRVLGATSRPVRDALARFQADRGGIEYRPAANGAATTNGAGVWTLADDAVPNTKTCYVVDCPAVLTATIQAIYLCLEFANITSRYDPENTAANIRAGLIAHARVAENQLITKIAAGSKALLASTQQVGALREVLGEIDRAVAYYRNRHRLNTRDPIRMIMPAWVMDMFRADLAYQMAGGDWEDALGVSDAMISGWFARRNVNITWHLDGLAAATVNTITIPQQYYNATVAGGAVPAFPTRIDAYLFAEGDWLFLDGGQLDLGVVRDSTLNSRNRYQQFSETFEGAAFRGDETLRLVLPAVPTGLSAGTVDTGAAQS